MKPDDSPQKIAEQIMAGASIDHETACALACSADRTAVRAAADGEEPPDFVRLTVVVLRSDVVEGLAHMSPLMI